MAPEKKLIGKDPREIADMGVSLSFVPEDRLGMGLVGDMDLTDNMMLRSFQKGQFRVYQTENRPKKLAEDVVEESGGGNARYYHTGAPSFRRKCAEGAGRKRDCFRTDSADDCLCSAWTGYQFFLYNLRI